MRNILSIICGIFLIGSISPKQITIGLFTAGEEIPGKITKHTAGWSVLAVPLLPGIFAREMDEKARVYHHGTQMKDEALDFIPEKSYSDLWLDTDYDLSRIEKYLEDGLTIQRCSVKKVSNRLHDIDFITSSSTVVRLRGMDSVEQYLYERINETPDDEDLCINFNCIFTHVGYRDNPCLVEVLFRSDGAILAVIYGHTDRFKALIDLQPLNLNKEELSEIIMPRPWDEKFFHYAHPVWHNKHIIIDHLEKISPRRSGDQISRFLSVNSNSD